MALVIFNVDQTPYCKGDVVNLSADELKVVDALAKERDVKGTYSAVDESAPVEPTEVVAEPSVEEHPVEAPVEEAAPVKAKAAKGGK